MKLGILSDTHGHLERTTRALHLLQREKVDHLIHCGDVGGDLILDLLFEQQETGTPVTVVPGNVDEWNPELILYARKLGFPFHPVARASFDSLRIAVCHGHDPARMQQLESDPDLDILFTGHTHVARDETADTLRIINPGAVYRAAVPSVAVLEIETSPALQILPLG
jgi:putative phosphoesterase